MYVTEFSITKHLDPAGASVGTSDISVSENVIFYVFKIIDITFAFIKDYSLVFIVKYMKERMKA